MTTADAPGAGAWVSFFYSLAADVHPGRWRLADLAPETVADLIARDRSRRTLSAHPECLAPNWDFAWNPWDGAAGDCAGWALWPGERIWRAAVFFAVGCLRGEIARLLRRDDVASLKAAVGDDAYLFALRRAPLVWAGDWPGAAAGAEELPLPGRALTVAARGLCCWLTGLPPGLASRVRLKLPPELDGPTEKEAIGAWDEETRKTCLTRLTRLNKAAAGL